MHSTLQRDAAQITHRAQYCYPYRLSKSLARYWFAARRSAVFTFTHPQRGPERWGASLRFATMPSRPRRERSPIGGHALSLGRAGGIKTRDTRALLLHLAARSFASQRDQVFQPTRLDQPEAELRLHVRFQEKPRWRIDRQSKMSPYCLGRCNELVMQWPRGVRS
jgi:hypothetical protein